MKVSTSAIQNGAFADRFGKRGSQFSLNGMPTYSIPFEISDAPPETQSFAVVLEDKDAITASGFVWVHWLIADLTRTSVPENDSQTAPPNCRHRYELFVYALDTKLNLPQGFRYNDLHFAMRGHILAEAYAMGTYDV